MKLVTLTRDMRPRHAGDSYLMPDAVADRLIAEGAARDPQPTAYPDPPVLGALAPAKAPRNLPLRKRG